MRQSNEKIVKATPDNNEIEKKTTFVLYRRISDKNKSQNIKRSYQLQFNKNPNTTDIEYSNSFIIPTVIQQDKESMYSEILALKSEIHNINEQNKRMMSKILLLEKENQKLKASQDTNNYPSSHKDNKQLQRLCNTLKERIRIRNAQYDYLEIQFKNLKTSLKKTKVSELEAQISNLLQQTQRLTKTIIQLNNYKESTKQDLQELIQTRQSLKQRINYIKLIQQQLQKLENTCKQNKFQLNDTRKKLENADQKRISETNELKRIIRAISKEKQITISKEKKDLIVTRPGDKLANSTIKIQEQYRRLETKFENTSRILEIQIKKAQNLEKLLQAEKKKNLGLQEALKNATINSPNIQNQTKVQKQPKKIQQPKQESNKQQQQQYDNQEFDEQQELKQNPQQNLQKEEVDNYAENFKNQSNHKEQQQQKQSHQQQQAAENEQEQQQYQPNSIEDIITFIVFKLKALEISSSQLKQIINQAKFTKIQDFIQFLQQQPFDLKNNEDLETLIRTIIKDNNQKEAVIKKNLYKLFPKYKLWKPKQAEKLENQIRQVVGEYARDINELLNSYKDENNLVDADIIKQLFSKMQLQQIEIDYILCKISLTSYDVHHMNYKQIFELFCEDQQLDFQNRPVDKLNIQVSEDSYQEI